MKERSSTDGKKGFVRMHGKKKFLNFDLTRSGYWLSLRALPSSQLLHVPLHHAKSCVMTAFCIYLVLVRLRGS